MKRERDHERDGGSATIWTIAFSMVAWVVAAAVVVGGVAAATRHRAAAAADLAALAGAAVLAVPGSSADAGCAAADSVATGNGTVLANCVVTGTTVTVVVRLGLHGLVQFAALGATSVDAMARAGAA